MHSRRLDSSVRRIAVLQFLFAGVVILVLACTCGIARGADYVLKGTLLTPSQAIANGSILIVDDRIQAIGADVRIPPGAKVIDTGGVILPGFVDLHNHLTWNVLPRWKPNQMFANRYDWEQLPMYGIALGTPHGELVKKNLGCAMNRYAEVKAIAQGETSVVGSLGRDKCIEGLARNLDFYSGFYQPGVLGVEKLRYELFPLELDSATAAGINDALDKQELTAFIVHLAEGKPTDAGSAIEFRMFAARGFMRPGVSLIHGVPLTQADFHQMAAKQVGLIWSPRSNLELYGATTDVAAALREHVKMSIGPDWSPTGSNGMLEELMFAATWNGGQFPRSSPVSNSCGWPPNTRRNLQASATKLVRSRQVTMPTCWCSKT